MLLIDATALYTWTVVAHSVCPILLIAVLLFMCSHENWPHHFREALISIELGALKCIDKKTSFEQ